MKLHDARTLFELTWIVRNWDDTEDEVRVIQLLGSRWQRYLDGPAVVRFADGQKQRWDLANLVSSIIARVCPAEYAYFGYTANQSVLMQEAKRETCSFSI